MVKDKNKQLNNQELNKAQASGSCGVFMLITIIIIILILVFLGFLLVSFLNTPNLPDLS